MKGTEKQIAWVEQIKTKALEMLTPYMDKIKTSVPRNDLEAQDKANALQVIDKLHTCDDATWYIDHVRHYLTAQEILTAAARDGDLIAHLS